MDSEHQLLTEAELTQFYDETYYKDSLERKPDSSYRLYLDVLGAEEGREILDVGCGPGGLLVCAEERGLVVHGADISSKAVQRASEKCPSATVVCANGEDLPYTEDRFDYVTCLGSLEHFSDPKVGLSEIRRILRPGGLACISVPNLFSILNFIDVLRTGDTVGTSQIQERLLTKNQWASLMVGAGFSLEKVSRDQYPKRPPLNTLQKINIFKSVPRVLYLLAIALAPVNLSYQFVFILKKV